MSLAPALWGRDLLPQLFFTCFHRASSNPNPLKHIEFYYYVSYRNNTNMLSSRAHTTVKTMAQWTFGTVQKFKSSLFNAFITGRSEVKVGNFEKDEFKLFRACFGVLKAQQIRLAVCFWHFIF